MAKLTPLRDPARRPLVDQPQKGYGLGMWAWLLQRITGLALVVLVFAHFWSKVLFPARGPVTLTVDSLMILLVAYHAFNGIRIALLDLGFGLKTQRIVFWTVVVLAAVTAAFGLRSYIAWYL